jgi:hypothetical protein
MLVHRKDLAYPLSGITSQHWLIDHVCVTLYPAHPLQLMLLLPHDIHSLDILIRVAANFNRARDAEARYC